jgi:hypothetical protein
MSGYPDDRDNPDRDRRDDGDRKADAEDVRIARSRVSTPAIGLIVVGALTLFATAAGFVQLSRLDPAFDDAVKQTENNPNIPAQQKKDQIQLINNIRDAFKTYGPVFYAVAGVIGVIVLIGGLRMRVLGSPGLVYISALLAMLPFSACCFLGVIFGIWTFVVMMKPEVKAGYAARRRASYSPDAY